MPETTKSEKTNGPCNVVICRYCTASVVHRYLRRHWAEDCAHFPAQPGYDGCTNCQEVKPIDAFHKHAIRLGGRSHTCAECAKARTVEWRQTQDPKRLSFSSQNTGTRPGKWVLRPCEYCKELFSARQMLYHRARCSQGPGNTRTEIDFDATVPMGEKRVAFLSDAQRRAKSRNLAWKHDICLAEYERMLTAQGGKCAICRLPPKCSGRLDRSLHVDHCHKTGKIRALLCHFCNIGLGHFYEDPVLLRAAIAYLATHAPELSQSAQSITFDF